MARLSKTLAALSQREQKIKETLDLVRANCDMEEAKRNDPIEYVHRYKEPLARELVALVASALAFGNVKALRAKVDDALTRLGPRVAAVAEDKKALAIALKGWKHRLFLADDLARLLFGARAVQKKFGSLGEALQSALQSTNDLRNALMVWTNWIRAEGGLDEPSDRRGRAHILADPQKGSAVKRLLLLLRWMVRPADGIDLGAWSISPSQLVIPVDTHIHKLSRNLGFTDRKDVSWRTAVEITEKLRRFDASDPVKYDFSLCHLGMEQGCLSKRDVKACEGCGVKSVCRHWE